MIEYGESPDNQMQLEMPEIKGYELVKEVRLWAARHYAEFSWYKQFAKDQGENASPNFCLQAMRNRFKVSIPNAYAPALARIAMEEDKGCHFRLAKSMTDGFCKVKL